MGPSRVKRNSPAAAGRFDMHEKKHYRAKSSPGNLPWYKTQTHKNTIHKTQKPQHNTMKTFREIAAETDTPESTLRLYRDTFEAFLPAHGAGRRRRYAEDSAALLLEIARRKRAGEADDAIRRELLTRQRPVESSRTRTLQDELTHLAHLLTAQNERLDRIEHRLEALHRSVRDLHAAVDDHTHVSFDDPASDIY